MQAKLNEQQLLKLARKAARLELTIDEYVNRLVELDLNGPDDRRRPENANIRSLFLHSGDKKAS